MDQGTQHNHSPLKPIRVPSAFVASLTPFEYLNKLGSDLSMTAIGEGEDCQCYIVTGWEGMAAQDKLGGCCRPMCEDAAAVIPSGAVEDDF